MVLFHFSKNRRPMLINYIAWATLVAVTILEVVFLVSLVTNANNYSLTKTSYMTLRIQYLYSWQ